MSTGRGYLLALVTLIVGLAVGFGATHWADQGHHGRKHHQVATARAGQDHSGARQANTAAARDETWDPMTEMDRMQQEIDQSIHRAMQQFRNGSMPGPDGKALAPGYALTLDVRDKGDHFEVRADLPNADKKDVKVTTEGDRQVHVNVTQHEEQNNNANGGQTSYREFGTYDQLVTLPEAVDLKDMKVDQQNGELVITIPKAKAS